MFTETEEFPVGGFLSEAAIRWRVVSSLSQGSENSTVRFLEPQDEVHRKRI
jgi:hypothetical protein